MGWKTFKEHFCIKHIVHVNEKGLVCIGSGYVTDLVVVDPATGQLKESDVFKGYLGKYYPALQAAPADEILAALNAQDEFAASVPVFIVSDCNIVEKRCEDMSWPGVTHDGELMYSNTSFAERKDAVAYAVGAARCRIEWIEADLLDLKNRTARRNAELLSTKEILDKLQSCPAEGGQ